MPSSKLFPPSTAIAIFQLASHLTPKVYAVSFTLQWESQNVTMDNRTPPWVIRSGIHLSLGTPRQDVWFTPLLSENETLILDASHLSNTELDPIYDEYSGGLFALGESSTWNVTRQVELTEAEASEMIWAATEGEYTLATEVGNWGGASIDLPLDGLEVALLGEHPRPNTLPAPVPNILGLGASSKFLENLVKREIIPGRAFGIYNTTLDIGGIDEDRITGERYMLPLVPNSFGALRITVVDVELDGQSIIGDLQPFEATVSMAYQTNFVPQGIYQRPLDITGSYPGAEGGNEDYTPLYPGWNGTITPFVPLNITLTLSNGYKLVARDMGLRIPVPESNSSMSTIESIEKYSERPAGINAIFGLGFFNVRYLYVDYERGEFELVDANLLDGVDGGSSASVVKSDVYAWAVVMFSSAVMVMSGVF